MIKKFNSFESYKEAPQAIEDLKYILEDEGISVSINGPEVVIRNIYRGISPIFTFLSIYREDGNFNLLGLILKSSLFASTFYTFHKSIDIVSNF